MSGEYIFLSYSHKDTEKIQSMIGWLEQHYHVWYDKNLGAAREYNEEIADQIRNAKIVIAFFSASYMESPYCRDEIMYARTKGVEILGVLIDDVQLSEGMQLRLGRFQMLNFTSDVKYEKIISNQYVISCKREKESESLLESLRHVNDEKKIKQLPRMLFATDFNTKNTFSIGGVWKKAESGTLRVPIGLRQDINTDDISEAHYDTAYGHQYICGKTMSGKSTVLQTTLMQLMEHYAPDTVQIYLIDFGNYMMELFRHAPHVGDVMNSDNFEKIKRFFIYVERELNERSQFFRNGSFGTYTQKYGLEKPVILIVIDGFEKFYEEYLSKAENQKVFKMVLREGMRNGILFLLEKGTTKRVTYDFSMENVYTLMAMGYETAEIYEEAFGGYGYLTDESKNRIKQENFELPGKGLIKNGKKMYLIQSALPIDVAEDYDRYDALIVKCKEMRSKWTGPCAEKVPGVPEEFTLEYFESLPEVKKKRAESEDMPIGLTAYSVQPISISLTENAFFPIIGQQHSERSNLFRLFLKEVVGRNWTTIVIDWQKTHEKIAREHNLMYASTSRELFDVCTELMKLIKSREDSNVTYDPIFIMIDGLKEFYAMLRDPFSKEKNIGNFMHNIIEKGIKRNIYFVFTAGLKNGFNDYVEPVNGMNARILDGYRQGILLGECIVQDDYWLGHRSSFRNARKYTYDLEVSHGRGIGLLADKFESDEEYLIKIPSVE